MSLLFTPNKWADYQHWIETDRTLLARLNKLLRDVSRDPFRGLGKPEPLKGDLSGWWSRRIIQEHRLVYQVVGKREAQQIEVVACRQHY